VPFDFDTPVERRGTDSVKWSKYVGRDILPMWVADMDFRSPPCVIDALQQRVGHGVFGYSQAPGDLPEVICGHLQEAYRWQVDPGWLVWLPGLVAGLNIASRAVGSSGDEVLTLTPVYPPFLTAPLLSDRKLVPVLMAQTERCWAPDWDRLESAVTKQSRLLLLCNPHNPVGRVYTREELERFAAFSERHDLVICSDEIHCGLVLDEGKRHIPIAALNPDIAQRTVTLLAPSKTFNIPGLGFSFAVIPDADLRKRFRGAMAGIVPECNIFAYVAALAAYQNGEPWRRELIEYLRANRDSVERFIGGIDGLEMAHVEATYLAWIDARGLGEVHPAQYFEQAGVGLMDGEAFGLPGFVRLNFGCPRSALKEALERIAAAVQEGGA
jgi:cystathionine beta-lyase